MKIKNEQLLMKKLGIDSWRNLSKDKFTQFVAMMPNVDKEVVLKVVEKFPEFIQFGKSILMSLQESLETLSEANTMSYQENLSVIKSTQMILEKQIENSDLTFEEQQYFVEKLMELAETIVRIDDSNKKFLRGLSRDKINGIGLVLLTAVVLLGGKIFFNKLSDDNAIEDS